MVEMLTTTGMTCLATVLKARCEARISAGTSLTGGSASAAGRLELKRTGSSLGDEQAVREIASRAYATGFKESVIFAAY